MSVDTARPAVCDLIFQLYGRPVHPELFDILAVRKLQHQDYQLSVWITRTGHVITWENSDVLLTEVTAAAAVLPDGDSPASAAPIPHGTPRQPSLATQKTISFPGSELGNEG